jgi:hypothetical protein
MVEGDGARDCSRSSAIPPNIHIGKMLARYVAVVDGPTVEFVFANVGLFIRHIVGPHVEAKEYRIAYDPARALRALYLQLYYPH